MTARLTVAFAGPHVTVQDGGRPGLARFGVPRSGAMDRLALAAAGTDQRLVFIILRGAMDGLAAIPPIGDARLSQLRGGLAQPSEQSAPC